jgi:hypothetical protein
MRNVWILGALAPLLLAGCAVETGRMSANDPDATFGAMKADQRVMLAMMRSQTDDRMSAFGVTMKGEPPHRVYCTEPSPDAIKAISESLSASVKPGGSTPLDVGVAQSFGSTVGYIGQRTVMVQAVRDLGYRACEAYMNGALSYQDYERIIAGAPNIILGLEAIDALAGPAPPATTIVTGPGTGANTAANASGGTTPSNAATANATVAPGASAIGTQQTRPAPSAEVATAVVQIVCLALSDSLQRTNLAGQSSPTSAVYNNICKQASAPPAKKSKG